jgi:hypothetical protein
VAVAAGMAAAVATAAMATDSRVAPY